MKKIFAILSVVAMMFASCTPDNGGTTPTMPTFPELQELTVESGQSYDITFSTDKAWTVSLSAESQVYATLTYTYEDGFTSTDTQFYGEAGEHTIKVNVREGLMSYAKDFVFTVDMTLEEYTQSIVKLTIPRTPYVITVTGTVTEGASTFTSGGHPVDGPFADAPNKYKVTYKGKYDGPEAAMVVEHNFDKLYNYRVYASCKDEEGNVTFGRVVDNGNFPWVNMVSYGQNGSKFRLTMDHNQDDAVLTTGVGYEAYVNIEDENGDAIVSVYYLYNPDAVEQSAPAVELAYPDEATANGVTFTGVDPVYTMTLASSDLLDSKHKAASLKITGFEGGGFAQNNLKLDYDKELDAYYVTLEKGVSLGDLVRENTLSIATINADGYKEYTITVIFDWIAISAEK